MSARDPNLVLHASHPYIRSLQNESCLARPLSVTLLPGWILPLSNLLPNVFLFFSSLSFFGILAKAWSSSSGHSDLLFLYEVIPAPFCIVAVTNIQASSLPLLHLPLLGSCQDLQVA